jgi:hypothetical protein
MWQFAAVASIRDADLRVTVDLMNRKAHRVQRMQRLRFNISVGPKSTSL